MNPTWLKIGEPVGDGHVGLLRIDESRDGDERAVIGTAPIDILNLIDGHEYQHDDGSLELQKLADDERDEIDRMFHELATRDSWVNDLGGDDGPLTERQAQVLWLREIRDHGRQTVADLLNISASTVDSHSNRARQRLAAAQSALNTLGHISADALD